MRRSIVRVPWANAGEYEPLDTTERRRMVALPRRRQITASPDDSFVFFFHHPKTNSFQLSLPRIPFGLSVGVIFKKIPIKIIGNSRPAEHKRVFVFVTAVKSNFENGPSFPSFLYYNIQWFRWGCLLINFGAKILHSVHLYRLQRYKCNI